MEAKEDIRFKTFTRRSLVLGGLKLGAFVVLGGRLYYLQVVDAEQYRLLAEENRINMQLLAPLRGRILDRYGEELAGNRQNYRIVLVPEQTNGVEASLDRLMQVVPNANIEVERILREARRSRSFVPLMVADNLSWQEFSSINVNIPDLPGVVPEVGDTRHYPYGSALAHVVGYVAAVSEAEAGEDPLLHLPGFRVGKSGIEKVLDRDLRGSAGYSRVEVNAVGRVIQEISRQEGVPGQETRLTIDMEVQKFAMDRLAEASGSGAAVVMDIHTGDIIAQASTPGFDPNDFNVGLSRKKWQDLLNNEKKPLINKPLAGQYPPGSTFKMVVAAAALEAGVVTADQTVFCNQRYPLGDHVFHCWKRGGHGHMNLRDALKHSCDVYFYEIAKRVGIDRIAETARRFGLGSKIGFDLPDEKSGLIPSKNWKKAVLGGSWQLGETLNAGIGQGYVLTTPLQLAVMVSRLSNGGWAVKPRLVLPSGDAPAPEFEKMGFAPSTLALLREGMNAVSNEIGGTAFRSRIKTPGLSMAGKTGTAQVRRITKAERATRVLKNEELPWRQRDHALFVAFAPVEDPRYAISIVVEHGGSGSKAAAPVARDIMEVTLLRDPIRRRMEQRQVSGSAKGTNI